MAVGVEIGRGQRAAQTDGHQIDLVAAGLFLHLLDVQVQRPGRLVGLAEGVEGEEVQVLLPDHLRQLLHRHHFVDEALFVLGALRKAGVGDHPHVVLHGAVGVHRHRVRGLRQGGRHLVRKTGVLAEEHHLHQRGLQLAHQLFAVDIQRPRHLDLFAVFADQLHLGLADARQYDARGISGVSHKKPRPINIQFILSQAKRKCNCKIK